MTTPKTYIITESQFKALIEKKKVEKKIVNAILEEITFSKGTLNEATSLNDNVVTILKKHIPAEFRSKSLVESLLSTKQITKDQLKDAGIIEIIKRA